MKWKVPKLPWDYSWDTEWLKRDFKWRHTSCRGWWIIQCDSWLKHSRISGASTGYLKYAGIFFLTKLDSTLLHNHFDRSELQGGERREQTEAFRRDLHCYWHIGIHLWQCVSMITRVNWVVFNKPLNSLSLSLINFTFSQPSFLFSVSVFLQSVWLPYGRCREWISVGAPPN